MSTRATIKIRMDGENDIWIYHHSDGYPEGVGSDLKNYLKEVKYWDNYEIANDIIKGDKIGVHHDLWSTEITHGDDYYELTGGQHGDEEYAYLIDCNKKELKCYEVGWDEFVWKEDKLTEIPD